MSRSALLTGVTGFIGGKLAERLIADGWTVHALLRQSSKVPNIKALRINRHDGSLDGLTEIVREIGPDVVFHLASYYLAEHRSDQVDQLIGSNILFPAQLAEAMGTAGATRLVNTGTAWQHFNATDYHPVNLYAATKQACEDLLLYFHSARDLSVLTLKLFDTYGADDKRRKLVQILVDAARSGERLDMSPGEQIIDLTHVDDVVEAFLVGAERLLVSEQPLFESYFVAGERHRLRDLVIKVRDLLGGLNVSFGARPYREREVMRPVEPNPVLPGWTPQRTLSDEIRSFAEG